MKKSFLVTLDLPAGVSARKMPAFIKEAILVLCCAGDPDTDPLFDLIDDAVHVHSVKAEVEASE